MYKDRSSISVPVHASFHGPALHLFGMHLLWRHWWLSGVRFLYSENIASLDRYYEENIFIYMNRI